MSNTIDFAAVPAGWIFDVPADSDGGDYTKRADGSVTRDGMITMSAEEAAKAFVDAQCRPICEAAEE